jgi:hypothetical protein
MVYSLQIVGFDNQLSSELRKVRAAGWFGFSLQNMQSASAAKAQVKIII